MLQVEDKISQPEQLKLFSVQDFVDGVLEKDRFSDEEAKYFKSGKFPPNNANKYYFGVKFTDDEHRELITRLHKPADVLNFYCNIWEENASQHLIETTYDRNRQISVINGLFGEQKTAVIMNVTILIDAIDKIRSAINLDQELREAIRYYSKIRGDKNNIKNTESSNHINSGDSTNLQKEGGSLEKKADRGVVYDKLGGRDNIKQLVKANISELLKEYINAQYVKRNIIDEEYVKQFLNQIPGMEKLNNSERYMAGRLLLWHFKKNI